RCESAHEDLPLRGSRAALLASVIARAVRPARFGAASYPLRMAFDLVLFGGTGDLTWRKLMPALFQAFRHGKLPPDGRILAVARDARSDDAYRGFIKERFAEVDPAKQPTDAEFTRFAALLNYWRMDLSQANDYA